MIYIRKANERVDTWRGLKEALRAGKKPVEVEDEIDIVLKDGQEVTLVCELTYDGAARFSSKDLLADTHAMHENWAAKNGEQLSTMEDYLNKRVRLLLPDELQEVIDGNLVLLTEREVFGENKYGRVESDCEQLPRYKNKENRIKRLNGVPFPWWLSTPRSGGTTSFCGVYSDGSAYYYSASFSNGVSLGFWI